MNKAVLYVRDNEQTRRIIFVHCCERAEDAPSTLTHNVQLLDSIYPKLRMDTVVAEGVMNGWFDRD